MTFKVDKQYTANAVYDFAESDDNDFELTELGEYLLGQEFLVLKDDKTDTVISFVLVYHSGNGAHYKCVFNN